jgi:NADP-dependent aldehyde dehydrogenase
MRLAAARPRPIPVYAEMGSVNPMIVLPGALAEQGDALATKVFGSCSMGTGQFCTNPGLLLVPAGTDGDAFVARLGQLATDSKLGAMLNRGIAVAYGAGSDRLAAAGIRLVGEGQSDEVDSPGPARIWEAKATTSTRRARRASGKQR